MEEQNQRLEIQLLREELSKTRALAQRCLGRQITPLDLSNSTPIGQNDIYNHCSFGNLTFLDLAEKAMNELVTLVNVINDPLWIQIASEGGGVVESLNLDEYVKLFSPCLEIKLDSNSIRYATRESGIVAAKSSTILNALMDENQWVDLFPTIIGNSGIIDMSQEGNGANLKMIYAELQALSPLVPVRKVMFLRFRKQLAKGKWGMVDVSFETPHEISETDPILNCRRFPSGCVVQDMPGGVSRVTWVEHLDYEEEKEFNPPLGLMSCSSSFGAKRWLASLKRQCQYFAIITSPPDRVSGMDIQTRKRSMATMAHRMVRNFGFGVCSTVHEWQLVQVGETKITIRNNINNPGEPTGVVLSASNSFVMPISHQHLFNFLSLKYRIRGESSWEAVHSTMSIKELVRIDKSNVDNLLNSSTVSFVLITTVLNGNNPNAVPILQETHSDESGSLLVYAQVSSRGMQVVMDGQDSSLEEILPTGLSIVPNNKGSGNDHPDSSTITVGFQMLTKNSPGNMNISRQTIEEVNSLMSRRILKIKSDLFSG